MRSTVPTSHARSLTLRSALLALLVPACLDDPGGTSIRATLELVEPSPSPEEPPCPMPNDALVPSIESDDEHHLVLRAPTGEVLAKRVAAGRVDDLSVASGQVHVLAATDDGPLWQRFAIEAGGLGDAVDVGALDGDGRLLATPWGVVVFEHAMGPRWRLWGAPSPQPSRICGRPQSIDVRTTDEATWIEALVHDDAGGRFELARARVDHGGLSDCERAELPLPDDVASPRLAWLRGATLVVASRGGELALGVLGEDPIELRPTGHAATRVEGAIALDADTSAHPRIGVLVGPEARLVALELDPSDLGRVARHQTWTLPGRAFERDRYFGRDLALAAGTLSIATTEGIVELVLGAPGHGELLTPSSLAPNPRRGPFVHASSD
jgi:hypothetical protein